MSLSCRMSMRPHMRSELRVSHSMRTDLQTHMLEVWRDMIASLRGERYEPQPLLCKKCRHTLTALEILKGFSSDPLDTTTACPKCGTRNQPLLGYRTDAGSVTIEMLCAAQTLHALKGWDILSPKAIESHDPSAYKSAVYHFGGLAQAFKEIGVKYTEESFDGWLEKVAEFLGKLPDTKIAQAINKPASFVRKLRHKLGIKRFRKSDFYAEFA